MSLQQTDGDVTSGQNDAGSDAGSDAGQNRRSRSCDVTDVTSLALTCMCTSLLIIVKKCVGVGGARFQIGYIATSGRLRVLTGVSCLLEWTLAPHTTRDRQGVRLNVNREAYAKSLLWNVNTLHHAECVSKGIKIDHQTIVTKDGWARIGRYAGSRQSAWSQQTKMRRRFPNLETKVESPPGNEWKAEIWVKRKEENPT